MDGLPPKSAARKPLVQQPVPASPPLPPRAGPLPVTGLPLDVLREVQEGLSTNLWMLALPVSTLGSKVALGTRSAGPPRTPFGKGCSAREARGEHRAQSAVRCRRPGRSWHPSARSSSTRRRSASRAPLSARCVRCGDASETRPPCAGQASQAAREVCAVRTSGRPGALCSAVRACMRAVRPTLFGRCFQ